MPSELVPLSNDTWVPILGPAKHPALGRPGVEVRPEMWHIIGEQLTGCCGRGRPPGRTISCSRRAALAANRADIPFAAVHLMTPDARSARLVATTGRDRSVLPRR